MRFIRFLPGQFKSRGAEPVESRKDNQGTLDDVKLFFDEAFSMLANT